MANTYTQIYIHVIFTVKGRQRLLPKNHKEEIHKYITGILRNKGQKLIAINSVPDHIHVLIGLKPTINLSDLIRDIKSNSSAFINDKHWMNGRFQWQEGFGAFSYSYKEIDSVVKYIENQEIHHGVKSFQEEYLDFLNAFSVVYDERYVFDKGREELGHI